MCCLFALSGSLKPAELLTFYSSGWMVDAGLVLWLLHVHHIAQSSYLVSISSDHMDHFSFTFVYLDKLMQSFLLVGRERGNYEELRGLKDQFLQQFALEFDLFRRLGDVLLLHLEILTSFLDANGMKAITTLYTEFCKEYRLLDESYTKD